MSGKRAVTQAEVAAAAGVSSYTVSCALRGQAQVAAATRERIVALAASLGYRANAAAAVLAGQRHGPAGRGRKLQLGWFAMEGDAEWREGFRRGCGELGYGMAQIDHRKFQSGAELTRWLWQRGVQGLVFHTGLGGLPQELIEAVDFKRFSVVKLSRGWPQCCFHLIRHSAFDYMRRALMEVVAKGYRRIAVVLTSSASEEDDDARLGAVMSFRERRLPSGVMLEFRVIHKPGPELSSTEARSLVDWLSAMRADAVLGFPWGLIAALERHGLRCPQDLAFATVIAPDLSAGRPDIAGCARSAASMTCRSVHELHRLITHGERGMASQPMEHVVEPQWQNGATLPGVG